LNWPNPTKRQGVTNSHPRTLTPPSVRDRTRRIEINRRTGSICRSKAYLAMDFTRENAEILSKTRYHKFAEMEHWYSDGNSRVGLRKHL